ncbi:MAG: hypothetical protein KF819_01580 [Labilithrix sp.]|nr:hypothetical protein [Labilithrix sp.]
MSTPHASPPFGNDLRTALVAMVRKRVPESEVEDIVQQALAEAIESPHAPKESEALRRWIFGVAKNKVVDYHRRAGRESFDMPDVAGSPAPHVEADLLRWAEKNLPEGDENKKTLDWMLREGDGEKLESIAASEKLPAPRVRQRVSRLRRHLKDNWQREVALLAALGVIIGAIVLYLRRDPDHERITHDPNVVDPRADGIRRVALGNCASGEWKACVEGLDEARRLDPAGDDQPEVQKARGQAADALKNLTPAPLPSTAPPIPTAEPSGAPSSFVAPPFDSAAPRLRAPTKAKPDSTEPFIPTPPPQAPDSKMEGKPRPPSNNTVKPASKSDSFDSLDSLGSFGSGGSGFESAPSKVPTKGGSKKAAPTSETK